MLSPSYTSSTSSYHRPDFTTNSFWGSTQPVNRSGGGRVPARAHQSGSWRTVVPSNRTSYAPGWHRPTYDSWLWREDENTPLQTDKERPWRKRLVVSKADADTTTETSVSVSLNKIKNRRNHHSYSYDSSKLILRRGQEFTISVTLNRPFQEDTDHLLLQFAIGEKPQQSKSTLVRVKVGKELKAGEWSAVMDSVKSVVDRSDLEIRVMIGPEAIVGEYTVFVEAYQRDQDGNVSNHHRERHPENVIILFNAWSKLDAVYMEKEEERQEYVMNESGRIMVGSKKVIHGRPWNFGQFDEVCLDAALYLLEASYLGIQAQGNPTQVARALTAMSNSNDQDGGVLTGNWTGHYAGGKAPTEWNGSVAILEEYMATKKQVKYSQCWVFSGLLTTLCRTLGIPARSVTNFESAHDTDLSLTIDSHVDILGRPIRHLDDSVWNFHVWNECWFKRPDLPPGFDGWQALDSTPQEESENKMRCGPASVHAIKTGNVFLGYDARFIFAEVNGDRVTWMQTDVGELIPVTSRTECIGKFISTKAVGSNDREDITHLYKYPEGSEDERGAVKRASRHSSRKAGLDQLYNLEKRRDVKIEFDGEMKKNGDVTVKLLAANQSGKTRTLSVSMYATAKYYNGIPGIELNSTRSQISLGPKEDEDVVWSLKAAEIINIIDEDASIAVYVMATVKETGQVYTNDETFVIEKPTLDVQLVKSRVTVGEELFVKIVFQNPLDVSLFSGFFRLEGAGIQKDMKLPVNRNIKPGEIVTKTVTLTPLKAGKREIIATFHSTKLVGIDGAAQVEVCHFPERSSTTLAL